jgi:hypothetical protein
MLLLCRECANKRSLIFIEGESYENCDDCGKLKLVAEYVIDNEVEDIDEPSFDPMFLLG